MLAGLIYLIGVRLRRAGTGNGKRAKGRGFWLELGIKRQGGGFGYLFYLCIAISSLELHCGLLYVAPALVDMLITCIEDIFSELDSW
jgi:hypothetical protein